MLWVVSSGATPSRRRTHRRGTHLTRTRRGTGTAPACPHIRGQHNALGHLQVSPPTYTPNTALGYLLQGSPREGDARPLPLASRPIHCTGHSRAPHVMRLATSRAAAPVVSVAYLNSGSSSSASIALRRAEAEPVVNGRESSLKGASGILM